MLVQVESQIPESIRDALSRMGKVVNPPSTAEIYAPVNEHEPYAGLCVERDVPYGPHARQLLDIFTLDTADAVRPILLFIHGGAFTKGDRRIGNSPFHDNIAIWAARHGLIGVNMTYRLAPEYDWPAAQYDIRQALEWLWKHASEWGGDANQIILMGHSAGAAHVAQYLAFPKFHTSHGPAIGGAAMLSGIYDPSTAECNPPLRAYFGDDALQYPEMSTLSGLALSDIPQLYAFAELDPDDFIKQAQQLGRSLRKSGRDQVIYELKEHSHMSEIFAINTRDHSFTDVLSKFIVDTQVSASAEVTST
jgi:triacylglycerol lipase